MEAFLGIMTALLGGCNIFQLLFLRSTRRRYEAQTRRESTEAEHARIDLQQDQYDYVSQQLSRIQTEYHELAERYRRAMTENLAHIDEKCREIADLRAKLTYFKGLRCYRSACIERISKSPYKEHRDETETGKDGKGE